VARKRTSSGGGISLDSLMDALTNVVAVLILVLVLVQADVSQKVQKFLDDLTPATPEQVAEVKKQVEELNQKKTLTERQLRATPATPEEIAEKQRQMELLERSVVDNRKLLADLNELRELAKKAQAQRDEESGKTVAIQAEIARVRALLDQTPVIKPSTPAVVTVPNSRPIPKDAKTYYALVIRNRVHLIDLNTPLEMFTREFERNKRDWLSERVRVKGAPDVSLYDSVKMSAHFANFDWKNTRRQTITFNTDPFRTDLWLTLRPDLAEGGIPLEQLSQPNNEFTKALTAISQDFKAILLFRVNPDSFRAYVAARELTEKTNIPVGWDMFWQDHFVIPIPDVSVKQLQQPPPPPPPPLEPPPPPPPAPPTPPPVTPKLD
jgi:uncharacterized protein YoxC